MLLSKLTQFAKKLWSRLSTAATQLFARIMAPAQSNLVTGLDLGGGHQPPFEPSEFL